MKTSDKHLERGPMNIAVWGLGRHAFKNVLPAVAASDAANLIGVYSRNEASCRRAEEQFRCSTWENEAAMLADDRVEAVYLATPIGVHYEQGLRVLTAGRHLLCEKSMTESLDKSLDLIARARQRGLLLCETLMFRFHPRIRALMERVKLEKFGQVVSIKASFFLPNLEAPGYRLTPELGGGAFLDAGCYPLSLFGELVSESAEVEYAELFQLPGSAVDTSGIAVLRFGANGRACLEWGYGAAYRNEATVVGEKQSIQVEFVFTKGGPSCSELVARDAHGRAEQLRFDDADGFVEMLAYARKALLNEEMKERMRMEAEHQAHLMQQVREAATNR